MFKSKVVISLLSVLLLFGMMAGTASAFNFQGHTYNETQSPLNNTNASIEVYSFGQQGPQLITTYNNLSNSTGYFNVSGITENPSYFYKIVLTHFNTTNNTLDYIGQSLPEFPYNQTLQLTGTPTDFYLRPGGTINISAANATSPNTFRYQVKDTRLGYPIASNFTAEVSNAVVYVPANRNYSIMIYPNQSFPVSYDLNNLTTFTDNYANITFNTSNLLRRVTGYANLSGGSANFTDLKIVAYLMEPGNMIFQDHPMPYNMSAWNCAGPFQTNCESDIYDPVNGTFNITLPGAQMNANILLFATAYNGTSGNYYGAFRNISLDYSNTTQSNFNFTLQTLLGSPTIISLNNASGGPGGPPGTTNVTTKKLSFQLKNGTSGANITGFAHIEVKVNYSAYNGSTFNWMTDVQQSDNGSFEIPVINADINKINIFTQDFAPLKTSKTAAQLASEPVVINLTSFNPGAINGSVPPPNIFIDMLKSNAQCDVPNPAQGCSLFPAEKNFTAGEFNPFKIVIGGGKISLRMVSSNNITIHYKNVDMLASGPPDALFDPSANQSSQNGSTLEQAWRFGSMGPEIYDEVLIGIPLTGLSPYNVSVKLGKLYDSNWNTVWNLSAGNTSSDLPSDYATFNTTWFNSTTGMLCSSSDITSPCYVDLTNRMAWITIPHFSGIGPAVSGTTGNLTATLANSTDYARGNINLNFTLIDTVNATSWYNITLPGGFDASGAIVNITINGSADPPQWTKNTSTLFINVSSSTVSANANTNQSINISNIIAPSTTGTYIINVTTNNSITVSLNYTLINATGSANGTVTDVKLGTPLASVLVTLTNTTGGTYTNTTGSDGYYYIPNILTSSTNPFVYTISASKTNYISNASSVTVLNSSSNTTYNITLITYNGTLQGTYNKAGTSIGISGATVNITNTTLGSIIRTTDSSGFYSASLYPATYTVNVSKPGYSNSNTSATVTSNATNNTGTISLSPNTVTITANRTVGTADPGLAQNVSFNLTVVNTGDDATFIVTNTSTNVTIVTNTTTPSPLELNTSTPTGY
ncbi:MAG: hypothetical protein O8C67_15295, partial [Candidatus Methanoperedens sp.]|nr:hypothetical protein [Candidatus Methanoperedens sp.]